MEETTLLAFIFAALFILTLIMLIIVLKPDKANKRTGKAKLVRVESSGVLDSEEVSKFNIIVDNQVLLGFTGKLRFSSLDGNYDDDIFLWIEDCHLFAIKDKVEYIGSIDEYLHNCFKKRLKK